MIEIELLLANGEIKTFSNGTDSDTFSALLCSLGALGIMLTATIQCEKSFKLHNSQYGAKLDDVSWNLKFWRKLLELNWKGSSITQCSHKCFRSF